MYKIICPSCGSMRQFSMNTRGAKCHICGSKRTPIMVQEELVGAAELLIKRGVEIANGSIYRYYEPEVARHVIEVCLEFKVCYDKYLFQDLPPGWELDNIYRQPENQPASQLCCSEYLQECELDLESIEFCKKIMISNLESWLEDKDIEGFRAVLRLSGYPVD